MLVFVVYLEAANVPLARSTHLVSYRVKAISLNLSRDVEGKNQQHLNILVDEMLAVRAII